MNRRRHREDKAAWLDLMETDGPFLAVPVVKDAWPAGLETLPKAIVDQFRAADDQLTASSGKRDTFIRFVLAELLEWADNLVAGPDVPPTLVTSVPEHRATIRPAYALVDDPSDPASPARALVLVIPTGTRPTARPAGDQDWSATHTDRLAHALRAQNVPVGLVTNGTDWVIVGAPTGTATSTAAFTRHVWREEPDTLRAFVSLVGLARFYGVPDNQTLPALLTESITRQTEITEALSAQSQAVVEMFVASIGRSDSDHKAQHGQGLLPPGTEPSEVYEACVTVLMRMVFLLYAEERGLLPADDDTYARAYAITTLTDQLTERADHGEDALERSSEGWQRLLATARAIHRGTSHDQLALPAYGGSLFDPDRFPWLEGRTEADEPLGGQEPVGVDDRTLLKALQALQTVTIGGVNQSVSFRVLDVEQIGYVYEGLLDQDANIASDWILGIAADARGEKNGPELPLTELETQLAKGDAEFAAWLSPLCKTGKAKRTPAAIKKALNTTPPAQAWAQCLEACGGNADVAKRVLRFHGLLRNDPRGLPVVYPPNSLYLTDSSLRASTGAVYTPRWLAEEVVVRTLEPLVKSPGPLDTEDESLWRIRTPQEILDLKVIDIAAGSGAFLASATRYLADRLIEAEVAHGSVTAGAPDEGQGVIDARRRVLDHCIYGVDINPMAVEMCKLSLWLITLDRARPFGFLDDRIVTGDSLLGIATPDQLRYAHFEPRLGRKIHDPDQESMLSLGIDSLIRAAAEKRAAIARTPLIDSHSTSQKRQLLREASEVVYALSVLADAISAASIRGGNDTDYRAALGAFELNESRSRHPEWSKDPVAPFRQMRDDLVFSLSTAEGDAMRPAHFPLLFPEVFERTDPGFDAVLGNPPFLGGKKITPTFGSAYREHLTRSIGNNVKGHADLVAFMFLTAARITRNRGCLGLIATNSVAQGDTREVGLDQLSAWGWSLYGAVKSEEWPTPGATLEYSVVWASPRPLSVRPVSDGRRVAAIAPSLDPVGRVSGNPHRLAANKGIAFIGSNVNGMGFTMSPAEAHAMIEQAPENARVLYPFLIGDDLNNEPTSEARRWIVNFHDWSEDRASGFELPFQHVRDHVFEHRQGLLGTKPHLARAWWRYESRAVALYEAIRDLDHVLALTVVSKVLMPVRVPARQVFAHALAVFATDGFDDLALLSGSAHYWWAMMRGSTMRSDPRYTPTDVFATFAFPSDKSGLSHLGALLDETRRRIGVERGLGLTAIYNLLHDPRCRDREIQELRDIHTEIDGAVFAAYGWADLPPAAQHHETKRGIRWTVDPSTKGELIDRLLELNFDRHAAESQQSGSRRSRRTADTQEGLFEEFG